MCRVSYTWYSYHLKSGLHNVGVHTMIVTMTPSFCHTFVSVWICLTSWFLYGSGVMIYLDFLEKFPEFFETFFHHCIWKTILEISHVWQCLALLFCRFWTAQIRFIFYVTVACDMSHKCHHKDGFICLCWSQLQVSHVFILSYLGPSVCQYLLMWKYSLSHLISAYLWECTPYHLLTHYLI